MFSALPIMVIPALKAKAAAALAADGVPMDGSLFAPTADAGGHGDGEDDAGRRGPRARPRRALVAGGALAVVVIATVIAVGASTLGDGTRSRTVELAAVEAPTTDAGDDTTVAASDAVTPPTDAAPPTSVASTPTTRRVGGVGAPAPTTTPTTTAAPTPTTAPPAPTTTTTLPPVTLHLSLNPKSAAQGYTMKGAPLLTWGATNAAAVRLSGPNVDATTTSGSLRLCPQAPTVNNTCPAPAGTYTYVLEAKSGNGTVVGTRTATLTITGSFPIP